MTTAIERPETTPDLELVDIGPWWTCPTWCPGDCHGGESVRGTHTVSTADRMHVRTFARIDAPDDDLHYGTTLVELLAERCDGTDGSSETAVVLRLAGSVGAKLDHAHRQQLIAALQAVDLYRVDV